MSILTIVLIVLAAGIGAAGGFFGYKKTLTEKAIQFKARMSKAKELEEEILDEGRKKANKIVEQAEEKANRIEEQRLKKMEEIQNKLMAREEKMDEKLERLDNEREKINEKQKEADKIIKQQTEKLAEISKLKKDEAKEQLFANMEIEYQKEIKEFVEKMKTIKTEEADKEAGQILAKALPRISSEAVNEFTTKSVDLPNEDYKGKLIGREGRNISFFEKLTGVELIIDDTPMVVRISSFDNEKRFIAATVLNRLVKDGRINPHYIEKFYNQVVEDLPNILMEKGKEALTQLNLPMMKPEVVKNLGQLYLRFSYGQNIWLHSVEVAKISESIATEIGLDPVMAKKAGLFHDIGKIVATTGQSHTALGAELLKKLGMDSVIINAAEAHHYDVPMTNPISWIVAAADAISASREGARYDTRELFVEKMSELEKLIKDVSGIDKVYIMQAGREIMTYVDPEKVSDKDLEKVMKTIGEKIEEQLDYPGIIRVTAIRENKIVEF
ncbi:MAG TPA: ribonuclease Y, partial [Candidatus Absconditabacterales bacterium]|nr:ribonuclease Y [Candidatus Absconditabacterales bacterium]